MKSALKRLLRPARALAKSFVDVGPNDERTIVFKAATPPDRAFTE